MTARSRKTGLLAVTLCSRANAAGHCASEAGKGIGDGLIVRHAVDGDDEADLTERLAREREGKAVRPLHAIGGVGGEPRDAKR